MSALVETAYAKINLALHVRRRRQDDYHDLETLFAFAEDGDRLSFAPADEWSLRLEGEFSEAIGGDPADNLILRAARAFQVTFGGGAGRFALDKRLPVAAGIGGGSADAAAALRLLARRKGVDPLAPELTGIAAALGADVPACLLSRPVRGEARGDRLEQIAENRLTELPLLLVNPRQPLATGPVFARWDGLDRGELARGDPFAAALAGRNDLAPPAIALLPVIAEVLARLRAQPGVTLARMSGSGATCFALFETMVARNAADAAIAASEPGWWRFASRLR